MAKHTLLKRFAPFDEVVNLDQNYLTIPFHFYQAEFHKRLLFFYQRTWRYRESAFLFRVKRGQWSNDTVCRHGPKKEDYATLSTSAAERAFGIMSPAYKPVRDTVGS